MLWTTNTYLNFMDRYHTNALDNKHKPLKVRYHTNGFLTTNTNLNIKDRYHTNALDNKHKPQHKR